GEIITEPITTLKQTSFSTRDDTGYREGYDRPLGGSIPSPSTIPRASPSRIRPAPIAVSAGARIRAPILWRASPTCRAVLQISLPHEAKARPRPMRAMQTHEPSPAFVDSPARRRLKLRYATTNTEARG